MNDFYLKAADEADFMAALHAADMLDDEGTPIIGSNDYALDIIGTIYAPTGNTLTDDEGVEYPEVAPEPGYHANYRGASLPDALKSIEIPAPATPVRVWA